MAGAAVVCPFCRVTIPPHEVAEGWCESCGKRIPQFALSEAGVQVVDRVSVPKPVAQLRPSWPAFEFRNGLRYLPAILLFGLATLQVAEGLSGWLAIKTPRSGPRAAGREETLADLVNEIPVVIARRNLYMRIVIAVFCMILAICALQSPRVATLIACLYLPLATLGIVHGIQHPNLRERNWESTLAAVIVAAVVAAWAFGPRHEGEGVKPA